MEEDQAGAVSVGVRAEVDMAPVAAMVLVARMATESMVLGEVVAIEAVWLEQVHLVTVAAQVGTQY